MVRKLLKIATTSESESVKLSAVRYALDRAGLKPPTQVEVGPKQRRQESPHSAIAGVARGADAGLPRNRAPSRRPADCAAWPNRALGGAARDEGAVER